MEELDSLATIAELDEPPTASDPSRIVDSALFYRAGREHPVMDPPDIKPIYMLGIAGVDDILAEFSRLDDDCHFGNAISCFRLGDFFGEGVFVVENVDRAREYYEKSCKLGFEMSCDWK